MSSAKQNERRSPNRDSAAAPRAPAPSATTPFELSGTVVAAGVLLAAAFAWAYLPTMVKLVNAWNTESDYSHGYLVIPVAILFLWARWAQKPALTGPAWAGLALVVVALVLRLAG